MLDYLPAMELGAAVLGRIGNPEAHILLSEWLQDRRPTLRIASVSSLGKLGTSAARESMTMALSDPVVDVRLALARSLSGFPLEGLKVVVSRLSQDPSADVRTALARALGNRESALAIDTAAKLAGDPEDQVRSAALLSLISIGSAESLRKFMECSEEQTPAVLRELRSIPPDHRLVEKLTALALDDLDPAARRAAIDVLSFTERLTPDTAVKALQDPNPGVRRITAGHSLQSTDEKVQTMLDSLARDPDPEVRKMVQRGSLKIFRHPGSGEA